MHRPQLDCIGMQRIQLAAGASKSMVCHTHARLACWTSGLGDVLKGMSISGLLTSMRSPLASRKSIRFLPSCTSGALQHAFGIWGSFRLQSYMPRCCVKCLARPHHRRQAKQMSHACLALSQLVLQCCSCPRVKLWSCRAGDTRAPTEPACPVAKRLAGWAVQSSRSCCKSPQAHAHMRTLKEASGAQRDR